MRDAIIFSEKNIKKEAIKFNKSDEKRKALKLNKKQVIPIDNWISKKEDDIVKQSKGCLYFPISDFYGLDKNNRINYFILNKKKCYNSDDMRAHMVHYINYFMKFYDLNNEYIVVLSQLKILIDCEESYEKDMFIADLKRYILSPLTSGIFKKVWDMTVDNYYIHLKYKHPNKKELEYNDDHGRILMAMSVLMNLVIPLVTHFCDKKNVPDSNSIIIEVYDAIFQLFPDVNMHLKLYETCLTNITDKSRNDSELWNMQDIRGINIATHAQSATMNIILNIMPKYVYDRSVVSLNFASIKNSIKYTIDIQYEFSYVKLSSSIRDEDSASEFDRFEAHLIKQNEALLVQNTANAMVTIDLIGSKFGPFSNEEVRYYESKLGSFDSMINAFQKVIIQNLFDKYFGDTVSSNSINIYDYIKLMIAAKRMLCNSKLIIMPYVISSKITKLILRKTLSKSHITMLESCKNYQALLDKYEDQESVIPLIHGIIASIIASEFTIIDYDNPDIDGKILNTEPLYLMEEFCEYGLLI